MSTTANDILALARSQIGVKEVPAGSNNVKYNTAYYGSEVHGAAYAWCCAFVWWLFQQAGAAALFYGGGKTAWCPAVESYAKSRGQWVTRDYQPGDCVLFDFSGKGIAGHIGVVESVRADGIICIEGNTSTTSNDNGGAVMRRTRYLRQIRGALRPAYSAESAESEEDMDISKLTDAQVLELGDRYAALLAAQAVPKQAANAWAKAEAAGIMDGKRPNAPVKRDELAIIMDRAKLLG
jgi:surface antigen